MQELLINLKAMLGISGTADDELLLVYLANAEGIVLDRLYPFAIPENATVPARYKRVLLLVAEYLWQKRGAEGERAHNENGINRNYERGYVPETLLSNITPYAKVM